MRQLVAKVDLYDPNKINPLSKLPLDPIHGVFTGILCVMVSLMINTLPIGMHTGKCGECPLGMVRPLGGAEACGQFTVNNGENGKTRHT